MKSYMKPEVLFLGDATRVIQSSKPRLGENGHATQPNDPFDEEGE